MPWRQRVWQMEAVSQEKLAESFVVRAVDANVSHSRPGNKERPRSCCRRAKAALAYFPPAGPAVCAPEIMVVQNRGKAHPCPYPSELLTQDRVAADRRVVEPDKSLPSFFRQDQAGQRRADGAPYHFGWQALLGEISKCRLDKHFQARRRHRVDHRLLPSG